MPLSRSQLAPKVLADAIGITTVAGSFTPLIPAGTPLPAKFTDNFSTARDGQTSVEVQLARESEDGRAPLGSLTLDAVSSVPRGRPRIRIRITVDEHGWLEATATPLGAGDPAKFLAPEPVAISVVEEEAEWGRNIEEIADDVREALEGRSPRRRNLYLVGGMFLLLALGVYLLW